MNKNRFTKSAFTILALIPIMLTVGCHSDQSFITSPKQEDTMQENKITSVSIDEITYVTWIWDGVVEQSPAVPNPENYKLIFFDNGTFSFEADCNSGSGSYTVNDSSIKLGSIISTMAICPPESLHDQYMELLGEIDSFGMSVDKLVFFLKDGAGEMRFTNGGPAVKSTITIEEPDTSAPEEKTIFVGPQKVDCVGVGLMKCYQVKEDPDDEWRNFYNQIEGFEWQPGYTYELRVMVYQVENPPADASSLRYELVEVVSKEETPVEPGQSEAYIQIEKPVDGTELAISKPVIISGMGAGLFEGNVVVQILDADGNQLALQPTIIQSPDAGIGGEGPWETEISISVEGPAVGKIVAFSPSPKDGESWIASDEVAVTFNSELSLEMDFENTTWILRSFAREEDINPLLNTYQVTAKFSPEDGTLSGLAGCNQYFTSYSLDGNLLKISTPIAATRMMCPEPRMVLEGTYLAALESAARFEMTCNAMEILDISGNRLLIFQEDPFTLSESFTKEELANTSYLNEFAKVGSVKLVNGGYREPVGQDSASDLVVMLTNHAVFGDVTSDTYEDAVVVLVSQPGGTGSFYDLAVVRKQDNALTNMARIQLGDRVQIKSLHVEGGDIVVDMLTHGPNDPMCCPTQYTSNRYVIESGDLVLVRSEGIE